MQLCHATTEQQWSLAEQFNDVAALTQWGGEGFRFPPRRTEFLQQLQLPQLRLRQLQQVRLRQLQHQQLCGGN